MAIVTIPGRSVTRHSAAIELSDRSVPCLIYKHIDMVQIQRVVKRLGPTCRTNILSEMKMCFNVFSWKL
jgi:hypothetical protein